MSFLSSCYQLPVLFYQNGDNYANSRTILVALENWLIPDRYQKLSSTVCLLKPKNHSWQDDVSRDKIHCPLLASMTIRYVWF